MSYSTLSKDETDVLDSGEMTEKENKVVEHVYKEYDWMWENVMNVSYREFNDRTLAQFMDDSQKRANSYVPSRDSQGKKDWQANVFTGSTRNKLRSYVSSVSKEPPEIHIKAMNERRQESVARAEVAKQLVRHSYLAYGNVEETIFFDAWDCAINPCVIKYDSWLYRKEKRKVVTDYDPTTGKVETEEEEYIEDRPMEQYVPANRLFIKNPYVRDIQEQSALIWIEYMDHEAFMRQFGKYKKAKMVPHRTSEKGNDFDTFFGDKWWDRTEQEQVEMLRYYNKGDDKYYIVANGVLIMGSPLLWGKHRKMYPLAKGIFEPFANSTLFWGNTLPNLLMDMQDVENAFVNSMVDKTYRTLETPMLIGMVNKDQFDLEDEFVDTDTKIYVENVEQVRPMPLPQVNPSEFAMLKFVSDRISQASLDVLQQGMSGQGVTAREIVIANERASEIKGLFFLMLKDLWLQKTKLRLLNVLTHYNRSVERILSAEGMEVLKEFNVPNTELSTGETGTLRIRFAEPQTINALARPIGKTKDGKEYNRLDIEEAKARMKDGSPVEIMVIPSDFLDGWEYDVAVTTESIHQRGKSLDMALSMEKLTLLTKLFPAFVQANQDKLIADLLLEFEDSPEKYEFPSAAPVMPQGAEGGAGAMTQQLAQVAQSLPRLTGAEAV